MAMTTYSRRHSLTLNLTLTEGGSWTRQCNRLLPFMLRSTRNHRLVSGRSVVFALSLASAPYGKFKNLVMLIRDRDVLDTDENSAMTQKLVHKKTLDLPKTSHTKSCILELNETILCDDYSPLSLTNSSQLSSEFKIDVQ